MNKRVKRDTKKSIDQAKENSDVQKAQNESASKVNMKWYFQIQILDLTVALKIFFVRVERGNSENQYPTEDMMRVKAQMMALQKQILNLKILA